MMSYLLTYLFRYLIRQSLEAIEAPKGDVPASGISEVSQRNPLIWDLRLPAESSLLVNARHRFAGLAPAAETMLSLLLKLKSRSDAHAAEHKPTIDRILVLLVEKDPVSRKLMEEIRELSGGSPIKVSDAERKRLARERQNAILAKFASQQKVCTRHFAPPFIIIFIIIIAAILLLMRASIAGIQRLRCVRR